MKTSPHSIIIGGFLGALFAEDDTPAGELSITARLASSTPWDADAFQENLSRDIQRELKACQTDIIRLKIAFVRESGTALKGQLMLTLRAEASAEILSHAVERALASAARAFPHLTLVLETPERSC